jgi:adenine deaminase
MKPMKPMAAAAALVITAVFAPLASAQDFDLVILNGRVMDPETKYDKVSNVGIKGDRIVKITTDKITGKKTIDAKGHAVVPGFINTHSHSFGGFDQKMMAHDGTTTILDTESGVADADIFYDKLSGDIVPELRGRHGARGDSTGHHG